LKKRKTEFLIELLTITKKRGSFRVEVLKVAAKSNPNSVAGALANTIREQGGAELQAIGAGALNQAIKAIIIARGYVAPSGIDLVCIPAFTDIDINGEERTAIKLIVQSKN
jgi:stage V sporulation protein S